MSDTYERLDKELVEAIRELTSVHDEYSEKYVSTTPLDDGPVPMANFDDLHEITERIKAAEKRYEIALQNMKQYQDEKIDND